MKKIEGQNEEKKHINKGKKNKKIPKQRKMQVKGSK